MRLGNIKRLPVTTEVVVVGVTKSITTTVRRPRAIHEFDFKKNYDYDPN